MATRLQSSRSVLSTTVIGGLRCHQSITRIQTSVTRGTIAQAGKQADFAVGPVAKARYQASITHDNGRYVVSSAHVTL